MKFLVECEFRETVIIGSTPCDCIDLTVDAPTARIAEYKVLNCYPDLLHCQAKLIEKTDHLSTGQVVRFCLIVGCIYLGILLCLMLGVVNISSFGSAQVEASDYPLLAGVLLLMGGFAFFIAYIFIGAMVRQECAEANSQERIYSERLAYRAGWADCENKRTPQFHEWVEEDSANLHPYPGPARRISRGPP